MELVWQATQFFCRIGAISALKLGVEAAVTWDSKTPLESTSVQHPTQTAQAKENLNGFTTDQGFWRFRKGLRIKASSDTFIPING